jgi:replicative DNA helicase
MINEETGMSVELSAAVDQERWFLGALIAGGREEIADAVTCNVFWRHAHKVIYEVVADVIRRKGGIDELTLEHEFITRNKLEEAGGSDYLFNVMMSMEMPTHWRLFAQNVTEAAVKRAYLEKCRRVREVVSSGGSVDEIRAVDEEPLKVGYHMANAPIMDIAEVDISGEDVEGISTGFASLDNLIETGGYPCGQMTVVSAYHKGGKSTFMLSSFVHMASVGKRVMYCTFADLNAVRLKRRVMRNLTGWSKMPMYDMMAQDNFEQTIHDVDMWSAWMYDATRLRTGSDVETFCRWLESAHQKHKFDAVFVDYAQKMTSSSRKASNTTSEQDVCSTELSRCFERTGITGIVGSQITEGEGGKRSMTKGSRKWEEDAGWVIRIKNESETTKIVESAFSRFGLQDRELTFTWNVERLRFEDRSI